MNLLQNTKSIQSQLAKYCRDGEAIDLPGITPNRVDQYRRLVFNIIQDNMESAFPIAYKYFDRSNWEEMVYEFFKNHACQSYQIWQLPGEFYKYTIDHRYQEKYNIPYLNDLLKFEWEEMLMYNMADIEPSSFKTSGDLIHDKLVINPEHKLLQLQFPIHLHPPQDARDKKGVYFVLLYREAETGKVQFIDLSVWLAIVVEQLATSKVSLSVLFEEAPTLFPQVNLESLKTTTLSFIKDLKQKKFILGFA